MEAIVYKTESTFISELNLLKEIKYTFKEGGFKALRKRYGWKIFAGVVAYYLIRDITIYLIIPYLIVNHL